MTESVRVRRRIALVMLGLSALAWLWLLLGGHGDHDSHAAHHHHASGPDALWPADAMIAWLVMLIAMMAPTVIEPLRHVWERSFKSRRLWAMMLFASGYVAVWMLAGLLIERGCAALSAILREQTALLLLAVAVVVLWQCAPVKQVCLNRNHNHSELRAFGTAADLDTLCFGALHGFWCVGSCWALMAFPLLLELGHTPAMLLVTLLMWGESLESPAPPRWRWRGPDKLMALIGWRLLGLGTHGRGWAYPGRRS